MPEKPVPQFLAPQCRLLKEPFQYPGIVRLDYVERYQRGVSVSPCPPYSAARSAD
jgi:hypothetical protein